MIKTEVIDTKSCIGNRKIIAKPGNTKPVEIHYHNWPHMMMCVIGPWRVRVLSADRQKVLRQAVLNPGDTFHVDPGELHDAVNLSAQGGMICCIFPHRNRAGDVVDAFEGNDDAHLNRINPPTPEILADMAAGKDTYGDPSN